MCSFEPRLDHSDVLLIHFHALQVLFIPFHFMFMSFPFPLRFSSMKFHVPFHFCPFPFQILSISLLFPFHSLVLFSCPCLFHVLFLPCSLHFLAIPFHLFAFLSIYVHSFPLFSMPLHLSWKCPGPARAEQVLISQLSMSIMLRRQVSFHLIQIPVHVLSVPFCIRFMPFHFFKLHSFPFFLFLIYSSVYMSFPFPLMSISVEFLSLSCPFLSIPFPSFQLLSIPG